MEKICSKCKKSKDISCFGKLKRSKDGYRSECKSCRKKYYQKNKKDIKQKSNKYYYDNKEYCLEKGKKYREKNKEKLKEYDRNYREKNKEKLQRQRKEYILTHKNEKCEYDKKYNKRKAKYNRYKHYFPESILSKDNISIEVKCEYCSNYFIPTTSQIRNKIRYIKGHHKTVNLYCSEDCKENNQTPLTSKDELEIQEYVNQITDGVICNDRKQILNPLTNHNLELDIYFPELNKAIEYNGIY